MKNYNMKDDLIQFNLKKSDQQLCIYSMYSLYVVCSKLTVNQLRGFYSSIWRVFYG